MIEGGRPAIAIPGPLLNKGIDSEKGSGDRDSDSCPLYHPGHSLCCSFVRFVRKSSADDTQERFVDFCTLGLSCADDITICRNC